MFHKRMHALSETRLTGSVGGSTTVVFVFEGNDAFSCGKDGASVL